MKMKVTFIFNAVSREAAEGIAADIRAALAGRGLKRSASIRRAQALVRDLEEADGGALFKSERVDFEIVDEKLAAFYSRRKKTAEPRKRQRRKVASAQA